MADRNYSGYSYWLESCGDDLTPRASLDGSKDVDVAILGAGFSGLWTAYYLLRQQPDLNVVVVEKEIAGFGASGRNGGWCSAGFPVSLGELERRFGAGAAGQVHREMAATVDEVGDIAEMEGIDCDYEKGGALRLARGRHQLRSIEQSLEGLQARGFADGYRMLGQAETQERVAVRGAIASLFNPNCATIHPGKLVRGLARAVERRGGRIYERTAATGYSTGNRPVLHTERGDIRADVVVLCGEAYLSQLDQLSKQVIPLYSLIVLTEPLEDEQWEQIGWQGRECISSNKYVVDYLSKTADGRILFGGRGAPYHFGSSIKDEYDLHEPTHQMLREATMEWFKPVRPDQFSHAWGGPLGVPRDWMPTMSYNRTTGIATARGYTGQGVATTNLSGRVLADQILGEKSDLTLLPTVGHRSPNWESEPFRYAGVRFIQQQYFKIDDRAELTGIAPDGTTLAERLSRH
ncbi:MAG: FAD-dependent oxidoreductase [Thermomicrobiales bacterium]